MGVRGSTLNLGFGVGVLGVVGLGFGVGFAVRGSACGGSGVQGLVFG